VPQCVIWHGLIGDPSHSHVSAKVQRNAGSFFKSWALLCVDWAYRPGSPELRSSPGSKAGRSPAGSERHRTPDRSLASDQPLAPQHPPDVPRRAGFSQERLAEVVGVERTTVMRWESGETCPRPWAGPKLARALGISDQTMR